MTTYTAAMYTASFALKMATLHIAIVYAWQKKMGKDTFFKAGQCAALSLLWEGKTTTSVEKGQFFMSQCRYSENEQKGSVSSPLPTIWILSKLLNLIGCQSNRKAKFAEKYSKIFSKVTLSFYSCLLRWASVAHWPLVILRPDSCVYVVILCFENSYMYNMSLKLLSKLELELLCSRQTTRPYFVQLMTLDWPWPFFTARSNLLPYACRYV